jgi:AraC family transcriptional activator of tynA and feaB
MPEILFALDDYNWRDCQRLFRGDREQEYYCGDYSIEPAATVDVLAERKAVGAASIIRLRSRTRLYFRRSWSHIRQDVKDVTILWFIRRGKLRVSTQLGSNVAEAGDFVVTRSLTPFAIECQTDHEQEHEALHVVVPTHTMRSYIADDVATGFSIRANRREFAMAEDILANLLQDAGELQPDTAELLMHTALQLMSHAIRDRNVCGRLRQTVLARRIEEVLRYIELHLSNPNLSTTMVANGCGISPRYLSFVLKQDGTTFSALVWRHRLKQAEVWLSSANLKELSISEIAYNVGFKSPAHFSRMFKRVYRLNPRDYRAAQTLGTPDAAQPTLGEDR